MVELQTANVLVELALEQLVGIAFVGDPHQALPVGHAGAMGSAIRRANAAVELDTVHRFRDPEYAALTLRLREASDRDGALMVAGELSERGHVVRVDHHDAAREQMIDAYFDWHARGKRVTLVSGTNAEADAINDAIQQRRVDQGELESRVVAWGMGEQRLLVGDTVQTRRNDRFTGVENRAQWIIRGIRDEFVDLMSVGDSGELRRVSAEYAREHVQLSYASTVHGVQGDTADASVVGPDVDAAGLYVGLTRGRMHNAAIVVARTDAAARDCLAESMQRGAPELTMRDAARAAQAEIRRAARARDLAALVTGPVVGASASTGGGAGWGYRAFDWGSGETRFWPLSPHTKTPSRTLTAKSHPTPRVSRTSDRRGCSRSTPDLDPYRKDRFLPVRILSEVLQSQEGVPNSDHVPRANR